MIAWWGILFAIGLVNFADTFSQSGDPFRQFISACYMLASLGLLVHITRKVRAGTREKLDERVAELEAENDRLRTMADTPEQENSSYLEQERSYIAARPNLK